MNENFYCVIMAGGSGVRFWPVSRADKPKQFIDILNTGETFLQTTYHRFEKICKRENIFIATNEAYKELVKEQLGVSDRQVFCEPAKRNTAPCIALASYKIKALNPNATIVVAPSDHLILKEETFVDVVKSAMDSAAKNKWLITIGIKPHNPNTGYGYIQFDDNDISEGVADNNLKKVITFTEKPPLELAQKFVQSGDFLWNAGVFIWNVNSVLSAIATYQPEINEIFAQGIDVYNTDKKVEFIKKEYPKCPNISIDYGVMEKASNVYVFAAEFGWSDLGTWCSLFENYHEKDNDNNAIIGENVMIYDSKNCVIRASDDKLMVIQGLDDYIVADNRNALLICKKSDENQLRQFVSDMEIKTGEKFI